MKSKKRNRAKPNLSSFNSYIECICPRCHKTYKRRMFWAGKGIPKKFCEPCLKRDSVDFAVDPELIGIGASFGTVNWD